MENSKIYRFYTLSEGPDTLNIRYVGVTTKKVNQRFSQHKYCAMHEEKRGLPVHKWMYSKYKDGGNITVKEIDSCLEEEWEDRERYWIKYYKSLGCNLMNLDEGGKGVITKEKRSKSSIQRSIEGHEVPIVALHLDGSFYKEFPSSAKATVELGFKSKSSINNVLRGRSKTAGGYMWLYKKDYDPNGTYSYKKTKLGKSIFEFDIDGKLVKEWKNSKELDNIVGYSYNGVTFAIKNKKIYHDHYWSYSDNINILEYEPYYQYQLIDLRTNITTNFHSQADLCKYLEKSPTSVCVAIKENRTINDRYKIKRI